MRGQIAMTPMTAMTPMKASAQEALPLPHVLAVDDDPMMRELIAEYLGRNEIRVTTVSDGASMQGVLQNEVVDLVVLDLRLKGEDGMGLTRRLRSESTIPIIM